MNATKETTKETTKDKQDKAEVDALRPVFKEAFRAGWREKMEAMGHYKHISEARLEETFLFHVKRLACEDHARSWGRQCGEAQAVSARYAF